MARINYNRVRDFIRRMPVVDPDKRIVRFLPRPGQDRFLDFLAERQDRQLPPWVMVLKSRRVGMSKICVGLLVVHCIHVEHADARITAHVKETADDLFAAAALMQDELRRRGIIEAEKPTKRTVQFGPELADSKITTGTARTAAGGRGMGFSALLATEAAFYEQSESFLSLLNASALNWTNDQYQFIETTANGMDGVGEPYYDQWMLASQGQSDIGAFFLGPHDDPDCIIGDEELAKRIMRKPTSPKNQREEMHLAKALKLNLGQLAWRRTILANKCQGDLRKLHQEYPYWPEQAFVSSGDPVFTEEELDYADECVRKSPKPSRVDLAAGEPGHERTVRAEARDGPFVVFRGPNPEHDYYLGADAARGEEGRDFSAAVVWDGHTGEMVASYMLTADVFAFADHLDRLGRWYRNGQGQPAMMNPEVSCSLGNTVMKLLRDKFHYPRWYYWRGKDDKGRITVSNHIGWETNLRTRDMMMGDFRMSLQEKMVRVYDKDFLSQMRAASIRFGTRWDVKRGHDDLLMAGMIGWEARIQWPPAGIGFVRRGETGGMRADTDIPGVDVTQTRIENVRDLGPIVKQHFDRSMHKPEEGAHERWQWHSTRV